MTVRLLSGLVFVTGALIAATFLAGAPATEETFLPVIVLTEASESRPQQDSPSELKPAPAAEPAAEVVAPSAPIGGDTSALPSPEHNTAGVTEGGDSFEDGNDDYDDG